jgi:hypothetical protein
MSDKRTCAKCGVEKTLDAFRANEGKRTIKTCQDCLELRKRRRHSSSPAAYLANLINQSKYHRNKLQEIEYKLTSEDLEKIWEEQEGRCALSGVYLTHHRDGDGAKEFNASIDRIDPNGSYTKNNVQLVAYRVNFLKHTLSEDMLYWWVKNIHDFSCD